MSDSQFKLVRFNPRRQARGAEAAEVECHGIPLWMSQSDLRKNIKRFGSHPELLKALEHYKSRVEFPPAREQASG